MFHDDLQIQPANNWKRNTNEHPIDRILTGYVNTNHQIRNSQPNTKSNTYKSETKHIIQRQRVIKSFLNKQDEIEVGKPLFRKAKIIKSMRNRDICVNPTVVVLI
jgi:hypothetical protein